MKILAFDTSNQTLAVGLLDAGKLVGEVTTTNNKNHSTTLMPAIDQLMKQVNWRPADLDRIVVAEGPGSYTGLRIGVTTAKTLAATLKIDLVGISSLKTLAANAVGYEGLIVPFFDARRQNVYAGVYRWSEGKLETVLPDRHVALVELLEKLQSEKEILFLGLDRQKFQADILAALPKAKFAPTPAWDVPSGITLAALGEAAEVVSAIDAFVPQYLKRVEAEEKWLMTHTPGMRSMLKRFRELWQNLGVKKASQFERQVATIGMEHFVIRELTTEDIKELIEVQRAVYLGSLPWSRSAFVSELVSPLPHLYLCAENDRQLVAFCGCRIIGDDGHVTNVAVLPEFQGVGIGTYLLQQIEVFAEKRGCRTMSLEVRLSNRDAQRLYRKLGYVSRAIKEAYYDETNEDALDMVKYLEG